MTKKLSERRLGKSDSVIRPPTLDQVTALIIGNHEIDAVLFDAGGIFVIPDPTVLAPLLSYYGATTELAMYHRAHYRGMAAK